MNTLENNVIPLDNNYVIKKIMLAFNIDRQLSAKLFKLGDYELTESQLKSINVGELHPDYSICSDDILDAFLNGAIKYFRDGERDD